MKFRASLIICLGVLMVLSACQGSAAQGLNLSTETATPEVSTATPSPTVTVTPTITPTATATLTPTPSRLPISAGPVTAPILLYHHVTDKVESQGIRYNIPPAKFEEQIKWLFDNGYETITVSDLSNLIYKGGEIPRRPVIITFDDGNLDVFEFAYPILKKYGFVATFYIVENYIDSKDMISTAQVKELIQSGWEIGSHSRSHAHLTREGANLADEIRLAKLDMEEKLGVTINSFAYPYGETDANVSTYTSKYGFTSAVGLWGPIEHSRNTIFYLSRIEIENEFSMEQFISLMPWSGPIQ